jgi:hypothetical protein
VVIGDTRAGMRAVPLASLVLVVCAGRSAKPVEEGGRGATIGS